VKVPAYFPAQSIPGYGDPIRKSLTFMLNQVKNPEVDLVPTPFSIQKVDVNNNVFYEWLYQTNLEYGESYAIANAKRIIEVSKQHANILHLVAILEGKIVGQLTLYLWEKVAELDEFYVLESSQGKGIGKKLYQHAMMALTQHGMEEVFLVTDPSQPAKAIYERWGFLEIGHYEEVHFQKLNK
jgi:N-acetylglutamate synthase-like GNAT family acetyltransferase